MKKSISFIIISLMAFCAYSQNLYIGTCYVTTTDEDSISVDKGDKWTNRLPVLCDMFKFEQPDVLGLQAYTATQLTQIRQRLSAYNATGGILYNRANIQMDTCGVLDNLREDCTCTWAKMKKEDTSFYVFNFCFATTTTNAASSATLVRTAVGSINTDNLPVFIIGYLGVNQEKTAYSRLTARFNDSYTQAAVKSAAFGTKNNYDLENNHGTDRYDFVFTSRNVTVTAYGQLEYGYLTNEGDSGYKRRLPSSHFPVMAKVKLK